MSLTLNNRVVERAIPICLKEADEVDYPIPYLSSVLFGDAAGEEWIHNFIAQSERNGGIGTKTEVYEVSKFNRGTTRTLHRMPIAQTVVYAAVARHLSAEANKKYKLSNSVSHSFKPNSSSGPEIWDECRSGQRWKDFRRVLQQYSSQKYFFQRCDVQNFFNCIQHDLLIKSIYSNYEDKFCSKPEALDALCILLSNLLNGWYPNSGLGLPQGNTASFFFAELLLLRTDFIIEDNINFCVARFVDDYFLFDNTETGLAWQDEQIETHITRLGLTFNMSKREFGSCKTLLERLTHFDNTKKRFAEATSKLASGQHFTRIRVALDLLREEFDDYDIDRYCVNYLVAIISNNVSKADQIPDDILQSMLDCFIHHSVRAADAMHRWLPVFSSTIPRAEVQELLGNILKNTVMLDTDVAFCYGIFSLARSIHSQSLRHTLKERFEQDASVYVSDWSGSTAAKIGKALRAAQRHGDGNHLLMDVFLRSNHYHEMRRYTAVAATSLSEKQRQEFFTAQLSTCICPEERFVLEYLSRYDEQEVSSGGGVAVTYPDGQKRPRKTGY